MSDRILLLVAIVLLAAGAAVLGHRLLARRWSRAPRAALGREVRSAREPRFGVQPARGAVLAPPVRQDPLGQILGHSVPATRATAVVIVAVSVAAWIVPGLEDALKKSTPQILSGQLWRLGTVALVHGSVMHLFFNTSVFLDVGAAVERLQGSARMLAVFWIGTVVGTLASVWLLPQPAVGASGGVFALLGALFAVGYRHRRELPPAVRTRLVRSTAMVIGANVILGFVLPRVDWAAHLGGLAGGAALGFALGLAPEVREALGRRAG